jgi:hypothetical protein
MGRRSVAFERAQARDIGEKREAGGSGGEDATRRVAGMGLGPDQQAAPQPCPGWPRLGRGARERHTLF